MKIIWATYTDNVDRIALSSQFINMAIKTLKLGKKISIREMTIHNAHTIIGVESTNQSITSIFNSFHMSRGNVSASTYKSEIQRMFQHKCDSKTYLKEYQCKDILFTSLATLQVILLVNPVRLFLFFAAAQVHF